MSGWLSALSSPSLVRAFSFAFSSFSGFSSFSLFSLLSVSLLSESLSLRYEKRLFIFRNHTHLQLLKNAIYKITILAVRYVTRIHSVLWGLWYLWGGWRGRGAAGGGGGRLAVAVADERAARRRGARAARVRHQRHAQLAVEVLVAVQEPADKTRWWRALPKLIQIIVYHTGSDVIP